MTNILYYSLNNELDKYIDLLEKNYTLETIDYNNPNNNIGAAFVIFSYKAFKSYIHHEPPSLNAVNKIVIISQDDWECFDDPIDRLNNYKITEIITEPIPDEIFLLRVNNAAKRFKKHTENGLKHIIKKDVFVDNILPAVAVELIGNQLILCHFNDMFLSLLDLVKINLEDNIDMLTYFDSGSHKKILSSCYDVANGLEKSKSIFVNFTKKSEHKAEPNKLDIVYPTQDADRKFVVIILKTISVFLPFSSFDIFPILSNNVDIISEINMQTYNYDQITLNSKSNFSVPLCGYFPDECEKLAKNSIYEDDVDTFKKTFDIEHLKSQLNNTDKKFISTRFRLKNSFNIEWFEGKILFIRDKQPQKIIILLNNTTAKVEYKKANKMAKEDHLTGLYNRNAISPIETELNSSYYKNSIHAVCMLDVDNFKQINDTLGHHNGDLCLKKISRIIRSKCTKLDYIVRFGGDEFLVYLTDIPNKDYAIDVCQSIVDDVKKAAEQENNSTSISIGLEFSNSRKDSFEMLYKHADIALYDAKRNNKGCLKIFNANS